MSEEKTGAVEGGLRWTVLIPCLFTISCSSEPARKAASIEVRDSLGIRITENPSAESPGVATWRISERPRIRLGGRQSGQGHELFRVQDVILLEAGSIAVLNGGTTEVRVFSPEGHLSWSYGREGDGPGELSGPIGLVRLPEDSIGVWDWGHARALILTEGGELAREVSAPAAFPRGLRSEPIGHSGGNGLFVRVLRTERAQGSGWSTVPFTTHLIVSDDSTVALGEYPWQEVRLFEEIGIVSGRTFAGWGSAFTASGGGFGIARGESCEFELRDRQGVLEAIVRWSCPDRTVEDRHIEAYRTAELSAAQDQVARAAVEQRMEVIPIADEFAPYSAVLTDSDGRIWVRNFDRPSSNADARWIVFDLAGRMVATVAMPQERVLDVSSSSVATLARDELGVEEVRVYDLIR